MSEHQAKLDAIHEILNEHDGEEALKRIREVLYGRNVPTTVPTTPEKTDE
jgi:hypothetical protein